ncbi:polysaccharide biosynthesis tyrosine autokinase [Sphingomonas sp. ST-64]|uniref:non-specific protein-tyrosine kinase n=1 Tax=Sphingomonas plantiphila TaxID=3163295 RepID=A0ABW8YJJ3_9SPHN
MNVIPAERGGRMTPSREIFSRGAGGEFPQGEASRVSQLVYFLGIARKRKWEIVAAVVGCFLIGLVLTLLATPLYTATATIEIQRETQNFTNVRGAEGGPERSIDPEFYQTQYGLLKARSLAERVVRDLRLQDDPQFFKLFKSGLAETGFSNGRPISAQANARLRAATNMLLASIRIDSPRFSRLVDISYTSPSPAFSKRVVDAWSQHFISATLERRFETTSYARKFLEDRLAQLRVRIEEAERQLVNYAEQQGIVNLPTEVGGDARGSSSERSLIAENLTTLNQELARATADRIQAESRLGAAGGQVSEALANPAISSLRTSRADLASQYAKMLEQFEPDYPPARALQQQIRQIDRAIAAEEQRVSGSLSQSYRAAREREKQLQGQVEALKSGMLDDRRRSIQYNIIKREVDTNRQLYDGLLQRYKEIGVAGGVGVNNISVVDPAEPPRGPSSPRVLVNLLLSLVAGLALGGALAFLLEQLNDSFDDPAEMSEALGLPLLGTVPKTVDADPIILLADPKESVTEAYMSLRTTLSFATEHGFPRSLAITSSRPAEGKSTTSFAIATSLARAGRRVVLIDGDMRSPSLHRMLDLDGTTGLSNYLAGDNNIDAMLRRAAGSELLLLPAGPQPPNAADLLIGDRFERLTSELLERFDHILIDAPPVMGLADSPLIGSKVEGVVFVVEAHATGKGVARVALSRLGAAQVHLLGVIATKFNTKRAHYGYGYDYGYGYGYGRSGGETSE